MQYEFDYELSDELMRRATCRFFFHALRNQRGRRGGYDALGRSFLKWQIFRKVVRSPEVWLFFVNRQQYFSLPAEKLAGPPAAFVDDDIRAIGGKLL